MLSGHWRFWWFKVLAGLEQGFSIDSLRSAGF